jgi:osomolarity two-component system response regulator SSK1
VSCTIRISHKFYSGFSLLKNDPTTPGATPTRPQPTFSSLLLRRLLHQIGATLSPDLPPPKQFVGGRTCDFTLSLERGSLSVTSTPTVSNMIDEDPITGEPSMEQLTHFAESLKGKGVTLYANAKGSFAQHLTSYLTAWGMDVTHVSPDGDVDGLVEPPPSVNSSADPRLSPTDSTASANSISGQQPFSFIFIDDDVEVLKERLYALRNEQPQLNLHLRKRPALAAHHRPRSSPQIARAMGHAHSIPAPAPSVVVVHFTSLSNYKVIKDIVQSVMTSHAGSTAPLPEVMIIPKPAGPRRFLTALHTAVTKPIVDPFFAPIATSPSSPGLLPGGSFFHSYHNTENHPRALSKTNRPSGSRSNSDRSSKSQKDFTDHAAPPPPSPLSMSDNVEYFSEAAAKLGTSPSSGLVIQSPDGQPAGIFFHPRGKTQRNPSSTSMERDKGQLYVPSERRRSGSRLSSDTSNTVTFSSLHAVVSSPKPETWATSSPSARAAARNPISPRSEDHSPSLTSSSVHPRRSPPVDTVRRPTPPTSPQSELVPSTTRRVTPRRTTQETVSTPSTSLAAASKKVKAAAGDGNIVPPISVLIVDGQ